MKCDSCNKKSHYEAVEKEGSTYDMVCANCKAVIDTIDVTKGTYKFVYGKEVK